jgi:hypothetical protein
MVLPDYTVFRPTSLEQDILDDGAVRFGAFADFLTGLEESARSIAKDAMMDRVANMHVAIAYDSNLQSSLGLSFASFVPASPVGPLQLGEKRYFVQHFGGPAHDTHGAVLPRTRSCIDKAAEAL